MELNQLAILPAGGGMEQDGLLSLQGQGLYMDDVNHLRIMDPQLASQSLELKQECDHFLSSMYCSNIVLYCMNLQLN